MYRLCRKHLLFEVKKKIFVKLNRLFRVVFCHEIERTKTPVQTKEKSPEGTRKKLLLAQRSPKLFFARCCASRRVLSQFSDTFSPSLGRPSCMKEKTCLSLTITAFLSTLLLDPWHKASIFTTRSRTSTSTKEEKKRLLASLTPSFDGQPENRSKSLFLRGPI